MLLTNLARTFRKVPFAVIGLENCFGPYYLFNFCDIFIRVSLLPPCTSFPFQIALIIVAKYSEKHILVGASNNSNDDVSDNNNK